VATLIGKLKIEIAAVGTWN